MRPISLLLGDTRVVRNSSACNDDWLQCERPRCQTPTERGECRVHASGTSLAVLSDDECAGAIDQDPPGDTAERAERAGETLPPIVLALAQGRADEDSARISKHRDEEVHLGPNARDTDPLLAEVDLHLLAGHRLEPHRRELGCPPRLAMRREHALQRAERYVDVTLRQQLLHDDAIACRVSVEQRARQRLLMLVQRPCAGRVCVSASAPPRRYRFTLLREQPSSTAMRRLPQPIW
jgi:hypothetical protein